MYLEHYIIIRIHLSLQMNVSTKVRDTAKVRPGETDVSLIVSVQMPPEAIITANPCK